MSDASFSDNTPEVFDFLTLADAGDWAAFDNKVLEICDDKAWFAWTFMGLDDDRENARDLAISILEKTSFPLVDEQVYRLYIILGGDESLHLRRKAAIALFRDGDKSPTVIKSLKEALLNDPELAVEVAELLSSLE